MEKPNNANKQKNIPKVIDFEDISIMEFSS